MRLVTDYFFFKYPPSSGIAPCVGTAGTVQTPTLDAALLSSSRADADLGRMSDSTWLDWLLNYCLLKISSFL